MNSVGMHGNLAADPELRYTTTGKAVCNFRLAVNSGFGEKRETEFVNCVAWEKLAEKVADQGRKGNEVAVFGRLKSRTWKDREGNPQKTIEIHASVAVVGHPPAVTAGRPQPTREQPELDVDDFGEIPF